VIRPPTSLRPAATAAARLAQWRADGGWAASHARRIGRPVPAPPPLRYAD
jgi:hypothetical protein